MSADPPGTVHTLESRPILWTDEAGVTHRCEGAEMFPDVTRFWTLCGRDLPENNVAYLPGDEDKVTCPKVQGGGNALQPPHVDDADKPLRRAVALAYRGALEAGWPHRRAYEAAGAVYCAERPGQERLAASARVSINAEYRRTTVSFSLSIDDRHGSGRRGRLPN